jgi:hypothetical protein
MTSLSKITQKYSRSRGRDLNQGPREKKKDLFCRKNGSVGTYSAKLRTHYTSRVL